MPYRAYGWPLSGYLHRDHSPSKMFVYFLRHRSPGVRTKSYRETGPPRMSSSMAFQSEMRSCVPRLHAALNVQFDGFSKRNAVVRSATSCLLTSLDRVTGEVVVAIMSLLPVVHLPESAFQAAGLRGLTPRREQPNKLAESDFNMPTS